MPAVTARLVRLLAFDAQGGIGNGHQTLAADRLLALGTQAVAPLLDATQRRGRVDADAVPAQRVGERTARRRGHPEHPAVGPVAVDAEDAPVGEVEDRARHRVLVELAGVGQQQADDRGVVGVGRVGWAGWQTLPGHSA